METPWGWPVLLSRRRSFWNGEWKSSGICPPLISKPFKNPAIVAAEHNDTTMLLYWLGKEKELFAGDPEYVGEVFYAAIYMVSMINQYKMLACVIADDELFGVLKEIYSQVDDVESVRLYLSALRHIKDTALEGGKKELRKILNERKKSIAE